MFIYVDESGSFVYPGDGGHSFSCAGALTIPSRRHGQALKSFSRLKRSLRCRGEIKGKDLDERQIASVIRALLESHARFHVCATDMAHNPPATTSARKHAQADRLLANVGPEHPPKIVNAMRRCQRRMKQLPDQLFVQLCIMTELVNVHLRDVIIHYALKDPSELAEFRWIVDQKGPSRTAYEELWYELLPAFIEGRQYTAHQDNHIVCVSEGDYSHFERFCRQVEERPRYLPKRPGDSDVGPVSIVEIDTILRESFELADSSTCPGLQLADVVTNAFRRAITGNLSREGWKDLGEMMFRWQDRAARLVHFGGDESHEVGVEEDLSARVIRQMTMRARIVLEP